MTWVSSMTVNRTARAPSPTVPQDWPHVPVNVRRDPGFGSPLDRDGHRRRPRPRWRPSTAAHFLARSGDSRIYEPTCMKSATAAILFALPLLAANDLFVGTWKVDTEQSQIPAGAPSFLMATIKIGETGSGLKSAAFGADGNGVANGITFDCSLDSKPCPVTAAMPHRGDYAIDTIILKGVKAYRDQFGDAPR